MYRRLFRGIGPCAALLLALPGCGSDELDSPTAKKLKSLSSLYLEFVAGRNGEGPKDEKHFKMFMAAVPEQSLSAMRLQRGDLEGLFTSERDGQPFEIVYGLRITRINGEEAPVVAHEKTGKDGKKLVGFANGKVDLVSEDRLRELLAAKQ